MAPLWPQPLRQPQPPLRPARQQQPGCGMDVAGSQAEWHTTRAQPTPNPRPSPGSSRASTRTGNRRRPSARSSRPTATLMAATGSLGLSPSSAAVRNGVSPDALHVRTRMIHTCGTEQSGRAVGRWWMGAGGGGPAARWRLGRCGWPRGVKQRGSLAGLGSTPPHVPSHCHRHQPQPTAAN